MWQHKLMKLSDKLDAEKQITLPRIRSASGFKASEQQKEQLICSLMGDFIQNEQKFMTRNGKNKKAMVNWGKIRKFVSEETIRKRKSRKKVAKMHEIVAMAWRKEAIRLKKSQHLEKNQEVKAAVRRRKSFVASIEQQAKKANERKSEIHKKAEKFVEKKYETKQQRAIRLKLEFEEQNKRTQARKEKEMREFAGQQNDKFYQHHLNKLAATNQYLEHKREILSAAEVKTQNAKKKKQRLLNDLKLQKAQEWDLKMKQSESNRFMRAKNEDAYKEKAENIMNRVCQRMQNFAELKERYKQLSITNGMLKSQSDKKRRSDLEQRNYEMKERLKDKLREKAIAAKKRLKEQKERKEKERQELKEYNEMKRRNSQLKKQKKIKMEEKNRKNLAKRRKKKERELRLKEKARDACTKESKAFNDKAMLLRKELTEDFKRLQVDKMTPKVVRQMSMKLKIVDAME